MSDQAEHDDGICMPCRGTGTLSSGLGGEPHPVSCPWCRGTGRRIPGIDAQEHPSERPEPADPPAGASAGGDSGALRAT
ncbi:MAG: hypothetical protein M3022_11400 [Actinomycetota bacterium]|nr:hypothetical protein [Actinomycetota bacterium]